RAEPVSWRAEGGEPRRWTARPDAGWVRLTTDHGETPSRLSVHADPAGLGPGEHLAHVRIDSDDDSRRAAILGVKLRVGDAPPVAANGSGCAMRDRRLHVDRGATCSLAVQGLGARARGLIRSQGRYLRGDPSDLLAGPSKLERRESLPAEMRIYLLHRKHSAEVVAHPQPAGPFSGWAQIDEERTDALVLRVPE